MRRICHICLAFLVTLFITQCNHTPEKYPRMVGDITADKTLDDPDFKPCNESQAKQYHNFGNGFQYKGEKLALVSHFDKYRPPYSSSESGLIRIRFLVTCRGDVGRFRMISMDEEYQPKKFSEEITTQLLNITKGLPGWPIRKIDNVPRDYYVYLIFKIKNGTLVEILP